MEFIHTNLSLTPGDYAATILGYKIKILEICEQSDDSNTQIVAADQVYPMGSTVVDHMVPGTTTVSGVLLANAACTTEYSAVSTEPVCYEVSSGSGGACTAATTDCACVPPSHAYFPANTKTYVAAQLSGVYTPTTGQVRTRPPAPRANAPALPTPPALLTRLVPAASEPRGEVRAGLSRCPG